MRGPGKTQPQIIRTEARRQRVLELRMAGCTYRRIAALMWADRAWRSRLPSSYNERHCYEDVAISLKRQRAAFDESVALVRKVELERLDRMTLAVWARAQSGDCQAIATVLKLMERRGRLLPGLESPQQVALTPPGKPEAPASPEDIQAVGYYLAQYGLYQQHHGNGLVTEPPIEGGADQE